ncbi:MAG: hypothetical protein FWD70_00835 [Desulfuromonadales bacterium]|nr:hypothetical protein [Desulfuromonadales bacterium]
MSSKAGPSCFGCMGFIILFSCFMASLGSRNIILPIFFFVIFLIFVSWQFTEGVKKSSTKKESYKDLEKELPDLNMDKQWVNKDAKSIEETESIIDPSQILQNIDKNERGWEAILFSEVIDAGIKNSADLKRACNDNIPEALSTLKRDVAIETVEWLSAKTKEIITMIKSFESSGDHIIEAEFLDAMGAEGTPADADKIIKVAEKIVERYRYLCKSAIDFNSLIVNQELREISLEIKRGFLLSPIADMEKSNEEMKEQIRKIQANESDLFNPKFLMTHAIDMPKLQAKIESLSKKLRKSVIEEYKANLNSK